MKTTEEAADMVLRAAGSSLANYTMAGTREAIFAAIYKIQRDAYLDGYSHGKHDRLEEMSATPPEAK